MSKKLALITTETKTFTSKKIIEEAQKAGAQVEIINPFEVYFSVDKKGPQAFLNKKPLEKFDACYRKNITNPKSKKIEVFLWGKGVKTINTPKQNYLKSQFQSGGKFGVYQILAKNKIPIPKSFLLTNLKEREVCLNFFKEKFPLILKTNTGTHGIGVILVDSKTTFNSLTDYLFRKDLLKEIIVQEFIKNSFGKDKRVIVLNNEILASVERKNEQGDFRSNVFLGAQVYQTKLSQREVEIVLKTMKVLHLNFAGLDLLYGENDPVITEVNSPCDYSFVEKKTGVPITQKIIKFLLEV